MIMRHYFLFIFLLSLPIHYALLGQPTNEVIKKLERHAYLLKKFDYCAKYNKIALYTLDYQGSAFNHELVQWCAKMIMQEQSLDALADAWNIFLQHKETNAIDDAIFLYDYAILIFMTYKQILVDKVYFYDIALLYTQISQIPLGELLSLIDQSYEQLIAIFSNYPYQGSVMLWFKNYWWVPPVALASLCASFLQWYILGRSQTDLIK